MTLWCVVLVELRTSGVAEAAGAALAQRAVVLSVLHSTKGLARRRGRVAFSSDGASDADKGAIRDVSSGRDHSVDRVSSNTLLLRLLHRCGRPAHGGRRVSGREPAGEARLPQRQQQPHAQDDRKSLAPLPREYHRASRLRPAQLSSAPLSWELRLSLACKAELDFCAQGYCGARCECLTSALPSSYNKRPRGGALRCGRPANSITTRLI